MTDLRPSNFRDLAIRIFTDKGLALEFEHNKRRNPKHHEYELKQLHSYCNLVASEMHENHECLKTGGLSAYGMDYKLLSEHFSDYLVDKIFSKWVDYSID